MSRRGCWTVLFLVALVFFAAWTTRNTPTSTELPQSTMPSPTSALQSTESLINTATYLPNSDAAKRETQVPLEERLMLSFTNVSGVQSVGIVSILPSEPIYVYSEIRVNPGANSTATADALRNVAYQVLSITSLNFSVILDDGQEAIDYVWSNQTVSWQETRLSVTGQPP